MFNMIIIRSTVLVVMARDSWLTLVTAPTEWLVAVGVFLRGLSQRWTKAICYKRMRCSFSSWSTRLGCWTNLHTNVKSDVRYSLSGASRNAWPLVRHVFFFLQSFRITSGSVQSTNRQSPNRQTPTSSVCSHRTRNAWFEFWHADFRVSLPLTLCLNHR